MPFEFATANRILFGAGTCSQTASAAAEMGNCILLVSGRSPHRCEPLMNQLTARDLRVIAYSVEGEPTVETVVRGTELARRESANVVVGCGGGSVLDAGKAIAALLTNGGEPLDYLEVVGRGGPITKASAPYIAIPTTAGTVEVTRNAVLGSPEHAVKVSLRSPLMLPRLAIVDPELTYGLPPAITATTGLDALTQLIEPFVSNKANPLTDALCREGMLRVARSLRRACQRGQEYAARADMALASLFGGLALANAKLGAVHGIAGPLGGMFPAPHGAACAALLPQVMTVNVEALKSRDPDNPVRQRFDEVARLLTGSSRAHAVDGVTWVEQLCRELNVPGLGSYGLTETEFGTLSDKALRASSMQGNPIQLEVGELREILGRAL